MVFKHLTRITVIITTLGISSITAMSSSQATSGAAQEASSRSLSAPIVPHVQVTGENKKKKSSYSKAQKPRTTVKPYDKPKTKQPPLHQDVDNKDIKKDVKAATTTTARSSTITSTATNSATALQQPLKKTLDQKISEANNILTECVNSVIEERVIDRDLKMAVLKLDSNHATYLFNLFHNQESLNLLQPLTIIKAIEQANKDGFDLAVLVILAHLLTQTFDPKARHLTVKASKIIPIHSWLNNPLNHVLRYAYSPEKINAALDQAITLGQWTTLAILLNDDAISHAIDPHTINGIFMQAAITYGAANIVQIIANTETLGSQLTANTRAYVYNYAKKSHNRDMIDVLDAAPYGKPAPQQPAA